MNTDSQPNALLMCLITVLPLMNSHKIIFTKDFKCLFVIALIAVLLLLSSDDLMWGLRSAGNYLSLFIITLTCYLCLTVFGVVSFKFYKISIWIWFVVGIIQKYIYNGFLLLLIPRNYDGSQIIHLSEVGRGVLALAPEATYYGFVCVQFIMFGLLNYRHYPKFKLYICLLLIQLLLLAKSTGALVCLIVAFGMVVILKREVFFKMYKYIIGAFLIAVFIMPLLLSSNSRIGYMVRNILSGESVITSDGSTNERFMHIKLSIKGSLESFGLPHGYENFGDYYFQECQSLNSDELNAYTLSLAGSTDKIMSSIGGLFYELGLLGMIPFVMIIFNLFKCFRSNSLLLFCLILFVIITLNALPFGQGFNCLLLANMIFIKDNYYAINSSN